jgi:hypothetical protein
MKFSTQKADMGEGDIPAYSLINMTEKNKASIPMNLLYDDRSISSGNSEIFTSKRSCTSFRILASPSSLTSVIARP